MKAIAERRVDALIGAAVGIAAFVLLMLWPFQALHPVGWDSTAIASGLLPQDKMLPGLGVWVARGIFSFLSFGEALNAVVYAAKAVQACLAGFVYLTFVNMMRLGTRANVRDVRRRTLAERLAAVVGALLFACADPTWMAAQAFGGPTLTVVLLVLTVYFLFRFLQKASFMSAFWALVATGFLSAETPLGWVVLAAGIAIVVRYLKVVDADAWTDFLDPVRMQRTKWALTFAFLGAFLIGVVCELAAFVILRGNVAHGTTAAELPLAYARAYFALIFKSVGPMNLLGFVLAVIVPCVLAVLLAPFATDEDCYLKYKFALIYLAVGVVAYFQVSPWEQVAFWSVFGMHEPITPVFKLTTAFFSALTLTWCVLALGVEVLCRDYGHIEDVLYQNLHEDEEGVSTPMWSGAKSVKLSPLRLSLFILPIALLAFAINGRRLVEDRKLVDTLYAFINETLDEARGTKYLFTDGAYDSVLRLLAHGRMQELIPVSLMSTTSRRDTYIRQMDTEGFDDRVTLETGATETLRTWVTSKSARLQEVSVQLAFELFRLNRRLNPIVYGALVRPSGGDAKAAAASVARCRMLSDHIVELHDNGTWKHARSRYVKDRLLFAQFRLAVISRLRAIRLDAQHKTKESIEEIAYSDKLNAANPSLVKILRHMDWVRRQSGGELTPREGLEVAMKRADFIMARRFAMSILKEDVDEPNANFAMGMSYYAEEQFAKAEEYLTRALKRNPKEPAIYNNLALTQLKTGRLNEAEKSAAKALELAPDVAEIRETVQQIKKARTAQKPF